MCARARASTATRAPDLSFAFRSKPDHPASRPAATAAHNTRTTASFTTNPHHGADLGKGPAAPSAGDPRTWDPTVRVFRYTGGPGHPGWAGIAEQIFFAAVGAPGRRRSRRGQRFRPSEEHVDRPSTTLNGSQDVRTSAGNKPLVTLIAPALNEADNVVGLVGFYREIRKEMPDLDFELILVDDGSTDGTAEVFMSALGEGDVARVARLSRNFGSHAAVTAGLAMSRGDCALTISTDLQEPLEAIVRFVNEWRAGNDIVWGVRETRAVPKGLANLLSRKFSSVFNRMSDIPTYPKEGPSQVLVSRAVMD